MSKVVHARRAASRRGSCASSSRSVSMPMRGAGPRAMRSRTAAARTAPSRLRAGHGLREGRERRRARRRRARPRWRSCGRCARRGRRGGSARRRSSSLHWPVVSAPSSVPTASTTSAVAQQLLERRPRRSRPRPRAGASRAARRGPCRWSARARRAARRGRGARRRPPARSTPPPAHRTGRSAARQQLGGTGDGAVRRRRGRRARRRACPAPARPSRASQHVDRDLDHDRALRRRTASAERLGDECRACSSSALGAQRRALVERAKTSVWRGSSCRKPRFWSMIASRDLRDDVDERHVGGPRLHERAGRDERARAGRRQQHRRTCRWSARSRRPRSRPRARCAARCSVRPPPPPRRPSQIASAWMPGRPKTASAPHASQRFDDDVPPIRVAHGAQPRGNIPREMMSRMMSLVPSQISSQLGVAEPALRRVLGRVAVAAQRLAARPGAEPRPPRRPPASPSPPRSRTACRRRPARAAWCVMSRAWSTFMRASTRRNDTAWCSWIGLPNVLRSQA